MRLLMLDYRQPQQGTARHLAGVPSTPEELYLDLMKRCLTRLLFPDIYQRDVRPKGRVTRALYPWIEHWLAKRHLQVVREVRFSQEWRREGWDWPLEAETM